MYNPTLRTASVDKAKKHENPVPILDFTGTHFVGICRSAKQMHFQERGSTGKCCSAGGSWLRIVKHTMASKPYCQSWQPACRSCDLGQLRHVRSGLLLLVQKEQSTPSRLKRISKHFDLDLQQQQQQQQQHMFVHWVNVKVCEPKKSHAGPTRQRPMSTCLGRPSAWCRGAFTPLPPATAWLCS